MLPSIFAYPYFENSPHELTLKRIFEESPAAPRSKTKGFFDCVRSARLMPLAESAFEIVKAGGLSVSVSVCVCDSLLVCVLVCLLVCLLVRLFV